MWSWKNDYTGAKGQCTDAQRLAMLSDPALSGLRFTQIAAIPAPKKPEIELPVSSQGDAEDEAGNEPAPEGRRTKNRP